MRVLAGDIGGTKTELALYEHDGGYVELERKRFASRDYPTFDVVLREFLAGRSVDAVGLAVAGPVVDGRCKATNLPWELDERALADQLSADVVLGNDFWAVVLGIPELDPADLEVLQPGTRDPDGPIAVIGAGTGLGEVIAVPIGGGLHVLPSEGGHVDFAARNETEIELLRFLQRRHKKRISVERAVSGPGLVALYDFVVERGLAPTDPATAARMRTEDPAAVIGTLGASGADAACARAVSLFVSLYGAEAGNLALKVLPTGGLYVAGGIAPKLIGALREGEFMRSMLDKGRMSPLLAALPVSVVMNPRVALLGARAQASMLYRSRRAR